MNKLFALLHKTLLSHWFFICSGDTS